MMTDNRSYKIYLVMEQGWEHGKAIRAFTLKKEAKALADKMNREMIKGSGVSYYSVVQIDLVTHDGAHVIHEALQKAVGKNG